MFEGRLAKTNQNIYIFGKCLKLKFVKEGILWIQKKQF